MFPSDDGQRFEVTRMCPVDSIQFFFSFTVPGERRRFVAKEYQKIYQEQEVTYSVGRNIVTELIDCRNNEVCEYYNDPLDEAYCPNIEIVPRSPDVRVIESLT
jgi:hypothetical protein